MRYVDSTAAARVGHCTFSGRSCRESGEPGRGRRPAVPASPPELLVRGVQTMTEMVWEDPPPPTTAPESSLPALVAELKSHPGKWALVSEDASNRLNSRATYLKQRYGCDAAIRTTDGKSRLYARWPE